LESLLQFILKLDPNYWNLLRHIQLGFLSEDGLSLLDEYFGIPPESIWECAAERIANPPPPSLDSLIPSDFPKIFADFQGKQFSLLWQGSRDGFGASEFHSRCDGRANTLTAILDTDGNIFGGFTPLEWESKSRWKPDDSQRSFLFTLKNPHSIPARKFALKTRRNYQAISCTPKWGPHFVEIDVSDHCNANTLSWSGLGCNNTYTNDTGLNGSIVFTGSNHFQVKEIAVFEITD
jgi:hypothetical protein